MNDVFAFSDNERSAAIKLIFQIREAIADSLAPGDEQLMRQHIEQAINSQRIQRDMFGLNPILHALQTAWLAVTEIGLKRDGVFAILLYEEVIGGNEDIDHLTSLFGDNVGRILHGLCRIHDLYKKIL